MKQWIGCAAICINKKGQLLMVRGSNHSWAIPSGGLEQGETLEECCLREVREETGCNGNISSKIKEKQKEYVGILATVHYFIVNITNENIIVNDPDNIIMEAAWKSIDEIRDIELAYPEDRDLYLRFLIG